MTSFITKLPLPVFYPTYNMLSCRCTRAGVSKLVYLSEVVGKAEKVPMQRVTGQRKQTIHYTSMTLAVGQEKSITILFERVIQKQRQSSRK